MTHSVKYPTATPKAWLPPGERWSAFVLGFSSITLPLEVLAHCQDVDEPGAPLFTPARLRVLVEATDLREAAAQLARTARAAERFDDAVDALLDLAVPQPDRAVVADRRRGLVERAIQVVGTAAPRASWSGLGMALGNWQADHKVAMCNAVAGGRGPAALDPAAFTPPLVGVFAAAAEIGFDGSAGVAPVRRLVVAGRAVRDEPGRREVLWEFSPTHRRAEDAITRDITGAIGLHGAIYAALNDLAGRGVPPPSWDCDRGVLSWLGVELKRITAVKRACQQTAVLNEFERRGWPDRIPGPSRYCGHEGLHEAVKSLNRGLTGLRFSTASNYTQVLWERAD